jgi:hypothetical protein
VSPVHLETCQYDYLSPTISIALSYPYTVTRRLKPPIENGRSISISEWSLSLTRSSEAAIGKQGPETDERNRRGEVVRQTSTYRNDVGKDQGLQKLMIDRKQFSDENSVDSKF